MANQLVALAASPGINLPGLDQAAERTNAMIRENKLMDIALRNAPKRQAIADAQAAAQAQKTAMEAENMMGATLYRDSGAAIDRLKAGDIPGALEIVQGRRASMAEMAEQYGTPATSPDLDQLAQILTQANSGTPEMQKAVIADLVPKIEGIHNSLATRFAPQQGEREGFTLAPGAQRFDADGRLVADNPREDKPRNPMVRTRVNDEGQQISEYVDPGTLKVMGEPWVSGLTPSKGGADAARTEEGLRKELNSLLKDFYQVDDAFARVESSAKNPSAAGDLALIFNFMKMLDPGSTVREGEFANAQNAAGVPGRVVSLYNSIMRGERLNENQRNDFAEQARSLYNSQLRSAQSTAQAYRGIAERNGVDYSNVVSAFTARSNTEVPPPPDGFTVIGDE